MCKKGEQAPESNQKQLSYIPQDLAVSRLFLGLAESPRIPPQSCPGVWWAGARAAWGVELTPLLRCCSFPGAVRCPAASEFVRWKVLSPAGSQASPVLRPTDLITGPSLVGREQCLAFSSLPLGLSLFSLLALANEDCLHGKKCLNYIF